MTSQNKTSFSGRFVAVTFDILLIVILFLEFSLSHEDEDEDDKEDDL
jgi:hypothetical protein